MPAALTLSNAAFATEKFGKGLTAGYGVGGAAGSDLPTGQTWTLEGWIIRSGNPSSIEVAFGQANKAWIGVNSSGRIVANYSIGGGTSSQGADTYVGTSTPGAAGSNPVVTDNALHYVKLAASPSGATLWVDGAQVATSATAPLNGANPNGDKPFSVRGFSDGSFVFGGGVDAVATWNTQRSDATVPSSAYTGSESGLVSLYQLDNDGSNSVAAAATNTFISRTNAAIVAGVNPLVAKDDGTSLNINAPGNGWRGGFTGTSLTLSTVALSGLPNEYPRLAVSIDGGPIQSVTLASGVSSFTLASGLASGTHTAEIVLAASDQLANRWSLACALKITGFTVDSGATITAPTLRSKRMIWFADSLAEGFHALSYGANGAATSSSDATVTMPSKIAHAMDAELALVAYSGQGFTQAGAGDVPAFSTAYSQFSGPGGSRLVNGVLSPAVDLVVCGHGTNGSPTQSDVATAIANFRGMAPAARIFMLVPQTGYARAIITAATNAAIQAGDTNISLIDPGAEHNVGLTTYGAPSKRAFDGLHPTGSYQADGAAAYGMLMQAALAPASTSIIKRLFRFMG